MGKENVVLEREGACGSEYLREFPIISFQNHGVF
jgi:hypothetical protein